jgi:perosamine synthetase
MINWWNTEFGENELNKIIITFKNKNLSQGIVTNEFEDLICQYLNVKYTIAVSSGSSALLLALMSLNIGTDDEVIIPNRTWIATAHAIHLLGAKVVPVDVQEDKPIIDIYELKKAITSKTKVIIPVHMNGRGSDIQEIRSIAKKSNIKVVEDSAQAIGSKNKFGFLGTQSDIGCFSLSVTKTISSGQGGFIVTNNKKLSNKIRAMRTHGLGNVKDPKKWIMPGFNFRYTDIQATIAIEQLKQIDKRIGSLRDLYKVYQEGLKDTPFIEIPVEIKQGEVPVYIEYLVPNKRASWINYLLQAGVETRPFYPDINSAHYFSCDEKKMVNSKKFAKRGIYLPSGPHQSVENALRVIDIIKRKL